MDGMSAPYGGAVPGLYNPHYPYPPQPQTAPSHHLYQQPQLQPQPPPPGAVVHPAYTPSYPSLPGYPDEVKTLFIAGLPADVKPREIYNLFRDFHGFRTYQIKHSSANASQAFAFAVFSDQQSALVAMHALNGMEFDLDLGSTLHVDLARSNSRTKRTRMDGGGPSSIDKRMKGPGASSGSELGIGGINAGLGTSSHNITNGYPSAQSTLNPDQSTVNPKPSGIPVISDGSDNPPCPTLFVANLGPTCTEEELTQLFSSCQGFLKLKMQKKSGSPVAFVDFQDTNCSTQAMNLQGTVLYSSEGEGILLEYAKSRMGLPKRHYRTRP